ncbi:MAG: TrkH family potassium uptake protein [Clostridia bacterium]|nr:TrkH family potassium uptake protein [Clostridia bacterium]
MNKRLVFRTLGTLLIVEALCMLPSLLIGLFHRDGDAVFMLESMAAALAVGLPCHLLIKPDPTRNMKPKDGYIIVSLAWVVLSLFGALPLYLSGLFSNPADAFFESVSGFTTTGSTVLTDFSQKMHGVMFWRSFTHWIGGMGVLVLTLALLPKLTGRTSWLVKAESPGPTLSKIVPKMGDSAKILYVIYGALTLMLFISLLFAGLSPYDAAIHAVGTAGTGGFSNLGESVGGFHSAAVDIIITVFMVLFGLNFGLYFRLITGGWRDCLKNEELRFFMSLFVVCTLVLAFMILPIYGTFGDALRYASFQTASIVSTTGFGTADFDRWPEAAKGLIFVLMFTGACVGSTAGGMKIQRVMLLFKAAKREVKKTFSPRSVQIVRLEGQTVDEGIIHQTMVFVVVYLLLIILGTFVVALDNTHTLIENMTAALTCVSNVGPGFGAVGPAGNFTSYSAFSKVVLSFLMLAGRLELFPILVLFTPSAWRR